MHFRQAVLLVNNKTYMLQPERANSFDEVYVAFDRQSERGGTRYSVFLHPKADLTVQGLEIQLDLPLPPGARFLANGFQSQSESRLYRPDEGIPRLRPWVGKRLGPGGDDHMPGIPRGRGYLHSWSYAWISFPSERDSAERGSAVRGSAVLGSLNESTGFTLFTYDQPNGVLTVRKDMAGLQLSHSFPALDFGVWEGQEVEIFDAYFNAYGISRPATEPALGYTGNRANAPSGPNEHGLLQQLERVAASGLPFRHFTIGEGWPAAAGDWLAATPAFPQGLGSMAQRIREKNLLPALWLTPFVAAEDSDLVRKHPDWLLKNPAGRPLEAGTLPGGKRRLYVLDFYNNEVRNYLGGLFHAVLDRWNFDMLHLDRLYAVCLAPPPGKTRGQVMHEAMDFLRQLAGPKRILAAGVPLGAAFGSVDFCRIGSLTPAGWENRLENWLHHRERESELASLRSILGRWQLNGRALGLVPGAFTLKTEKKKWRITQQQTLLVIYALLGNLLLTSDDPGGYSPEQKAELEAALDLAGSRINRVTENEKDVYTIVFEKDGRRHAAYCNLTKYIRVVTTGNTRVELQPFETLILTL